ncbi:MAG: succinyldiaminopimelate transaminase [Demequinaceae bacterium]|nr:succinyldiaminopimelate transaminase [Demequinaceae bacterium]
MGLQASALPDFPWDSLTPFIERASAHPGGAINLSVGTPVDPTPAVVRDALIAAADAPGYPTTHGTGELRAAVVDWFATRRGVDNVDRSSVLPTVGSKELVALLPSLLGLGAGDTVVHPSIAYPTYDVGARLAGATPLAATSVAEWAGNSAVKLVWVNSPSNPTGSVAGVEELRAVVEAARAIGAIVASDECYAEMAWEEPWRSEGVPSILDPRVCGGDHGGLLAVYSLSKQSNLAGYRAAFVAGDALVVGRLLEARKHIGMIMPAPVQAAMVVALGDRAHVEQQRLRYGSRRVTLSAALLAAGFTIDESVAGLYLWATRGEDAWQSVAWLAERGIVVAPGTFYGPRGAKHVRVALTASDEHIDAAALRLVNEQ